MPKDLITVYRDVGGDYRWRRQAGNGEVVGASTEGYEHRADALANIEATQGGEYLLADTAAPREMDAPPEEPENWPPSEGEPGHWPAPPDQEIATGADADTADRPAVGEEPPPEPPPT